MKIYLFLIIACILVSCMDSSPTVSKLEVETTMIDLGTIDFDSSYQIQYVIHNSGTADLLIDTITSSCGCSLPAISKKNIRPKDTALVSVKFKPVDKGEFNKSLVIKSNTDSMFTVLQFKGVTSIEP